MAFSSFLRPFRSWKSTSTSTSTSTSNLPLNTSPSASPSSTSTPSPSSTSRLWKWRAKTSRPTATPRAELPRRRHTPEPAITPLRSTDNIPIPPEQLSRPLRTFIEHIDRFNEFAVGLGSEVSVARTAEDRELARELFNLLQGQMPAVMRGMAMILASGGNRPLPADCEKVLENIKDKVLVLEGMVGNIGRIVWMWDN